MRGPSAAVATGALVAIFVVNVVLHEPGVPVYAIPEVWREFDEAVELVERLRSASARSCRRVGSRVQIIARMYAMRSDENPSQRDQCLAHVKVETVGIGRG